MCARVVHSQWNAPIAQELEYFLLAKVVIAGLSAAWLLRSNMEHYRYSLDRYGVGCKFSLDRYGVGCNLHPTPYLSIEYR